MTGSFPGSKITNQVLAAMIIIRTDQGQTLCVPSRAGVTRDTLRDAIILR